MARPEYVLPLLLGLSAACVARAARGRPAWYWGAALFTYLWSALLGFSWGPYTVILAFVFLALAAGHSLGGEQRRAAWYVAAGLLLYAATFPVQWVIWWPAMRWFLPLFYR
jgi:hypothetical protein